jgi:hypothetical protein
MKKIYIGRRAGAIILFLVFNLYSFSQSAIDPLSYGVVLDDPGMKKVLIKKDISYLQDTGGNLHIDIYSPPNLKATDKRPDRDFDLIRSDQKFKQLLSSIK